MSLLGVVCDVASLNLHKACTVRSQGGWSSVSDVLGVGHDSGHMQSHVRLYLVEAEVVQQVAHRYLDSQRLLGRQLRRALVLLELVVGRGHVVGGVDLGRRNVGEENVCQAGELSMGGVDGARSLSLEQMLLDGLDDGPGDGLGGYVGVVGLGLLGPSSYYCALGGDRAMRCWYAQTLYSRGYVTTLG